MKNQKMRQLRGSRTLQEVAREIGIPMSTYACIENGIRRGRPETMLKIAKFYGFPLEHVFFSDLDSVAK